MRLNEKCGNIASAPCDLHVLPRDLERCVTVAFGPYQNKPHVIHLAYLISWVLNRDWHRFIRFIDGLLAQKKIKLEEYERLCHKIREATFNRWWTLGSGMLFVSGSVYGYLPLPRVQPFLTN
jgi:hypothetical protein